MNHRLITLTAALFCVHAAHAQLGLRAGANFATLATTTPDPYQRASASGRLGYQFVYSPRA